MAADDYAGLFGLHIMPFCDFEKPERLHLAVILPAGIVVQVPRNAAALPPPLLAGK